MNNRQELLRQAINDLNMIFKHTTIPITVNNREEWQTEYEKLKKKSRESTYWLYKNLRNAGMTIDDITFDGYLTQAARDPQSSRALALKRLVKNIDKGHAYCHTCGAKLPVVRIKMPKQRELNKRSRI